MRAGPRRRAPVDLLPTSPPGYYKCRTIDAPLVHRFVRMYGGRAQLPSATWCLIDPLPVRP